MGEVYRRVVEVEVGQRLIDNCHKILDRRIKVDPRNLGKGRGARAPATLH